MKKKLVLKESIIDTLIDINLLAVIIMIFSRGTFMLLPALIICGLDMLVFMLYGGLRHE